jgi:hypothetical protein
MMAGRTHAIGVAPLVTLGRALYDDRYAEGRRFASVLSAQGVPTFALDDGDITRFWCDELEPFWRHESGAIAGFTQFGPMFVVERLAADRGLGLVLRVEHCNARDGGMSHRFEGPSETLCLTRELESLHDDWPGLAAALACRVGVDDSPHRSAELSTPGITPRLAQSEGPAASFIHYYTPHAEQQGYGATLDGPLYSWVVAPRASLTR